MDLSGESIQSERVIDRDRCIVCGGGRTSLVSPASGDIAFCLDCFHGWRPKFVVTPYNETVMCAQGQQRGRLEAQVAFFAPYAPPGAAIFEIGCATGELALVARERISLSRFDGNELSSSGERARAHLDMLYTDTLPDLLKEGRLADRYDIVIISHVLEHLDDPRPELRAMTSILKPGGVIFVEVPNRSGSTGLPIDDNAFHLSFFSPSSLTRLLAQEGLETVSVRTDVPLNPDCDSFYNDCLQVITRPFSLPAWSRTLISDHPLIAGERNMVVWGAGGLVEQVLGNYFDASRIDFFIDKDTRKHGSIRLGKQVKSPLALGSEPRTIIINSIDFAGEIAEEIGRHPGGAKHRVVRLGDLLSSDSARAFSRT